MHKAVFKNRLSNFGAALRHRIEHHELGLHIGGKTRVLGGAKTLRFQVRESRTFSVHPQTTRHRLDAHARFAQFVNHRFQMVTASVSQHHITARCSHRAQKRSRFNAVGHDCVRSTVQLLNTLDVDATGAVAFDLGTHGNQQLGQIGNLWLLGGVFQHSFALGQSCRHEEIFGASNGHHVSGNTCALQAATPVFQTRHHIALLHIDHRAHGLQAFDVLVHRACANGATAWQRDLGMAKASQQGAQCQYRGAHGFDQLVGCFGVVQSTGVEHHVTRLVALGAHAHVAYQLDHGGDILQAGHIGKRQRVGG